MSNLFSFGLGWACGAIGIAIVIGSAWLRFGRMTAIAAAYDGAILRTLRAARRTPDWQPPPTSPFGMIEVGSS